MIKPMAMDPIHIPMVQDMKAIGKKINKTGLVKKLGQILPAMRVSISRGRNLVMENLNGQMARNIKVSFMRIISMAKVPIFGEIRENLLEIGNIIKWMVKVFLSGLMEGNIKDSIGMIKKMDMGFLNGKFWLMSRSDGRKYKGHWHNGKQHGDGEFLQNKDSAWRKGIWNEGKRIRWTNEAPGTPA
jgi:hypothetical protein